MVERGLQDVVEQIVVVDAVQLGVEADLDSENGGADRSELEAQPVSVFLLQEAQVAHVL